MKNIFKTSFSLRVPELEVYIAKEVKRITSTSLMDIGAAIKTKLESLQGICNSIAAEFNVVKEKVSQRLQPEIDKLVEKINQFEKSNIVESTQKIINEFNESSKALIADISRTVLSYNWKFYFFIWAGIFCINMIDSIFNAPIFQIVVTNLLLSIIISIFIAGVLTYFSHILGTRARLASTPKSRAARLCLGIVAASIMFLILGYIRKGYTGDDGKFVNSPFVWMILNTFFFTVAVLITYYKMPTEEQELERATLLAKKKELAKLEVNKKSAIEKLAKATEENNATKQRLEEFMSYRDKCLISLEKEEERVIATCKKEAEIKGGKFN